MAWTNSTTALSDWMQGLLGVNIPDSAIQSILDGRGGISGATLLKDIDQRDADLLRADLYVWLAMSPSTGQSVEDSDGFWKHREGGYSITPSDKDRLLRMANEIYMKYGEDTVQVKSGIRIFNI